MKWLRKAEIRTSLAAFGKMLFYNDFLEFQSIKGGAGMLARVIHDAREGGDLERWELGARWWALLSFDGGKTLVVAVIVASRDGVGRTYPFCCCAVMDGNRLPGDWAQAVALSEPVWCDLERMVLEIAQLKDRSEFQAYMESRELTAPQGNPVLPVSETMSVAEYATDLLPGRDDKDFPFARLLWDLSNGLRFVDQNVDSREGPVPAIRIAMAEGLDLLQQVRVWMAFLGQQVSFLGDRKRAMGVIFPVAGSMPSNLWVVPRTLQHSDLGLMSRDLECCLQPYPAEDPCQNLLGLGRFREYYESALQEQAFSGLAGLRIDGIKGT